ncbi:MULTISPECIES: DUF397 domain-containing protein [unclassified Streptomyces]|uniref:DUF397 domain-containing protein n=1 Tax=unclassified Streptomyces TaxID=2593676 RepID=UPI00381B824B
MGTNCVEVAHLAPTGHVGIRDSKRKAGPALVVPAAAWAEFVAGTRVGPLAAVTLPLPEARFGTSASGASP